MEKQTLFTYAVKYHVALEMKDILLHAITWIKLKGILVSEIGWSQKTTYLLYGFNLYKISGIGKSTETQSRLVVV
jgi:hypothetical protein